MKKQLTTLLVLASSLLLVACQDVTDTATPPTVNQTQQQTPATGELVRFTDIQLGLMDTLFQFIGYSDSQENFNAQLAHVKAEMQRLHNLFTTFEEVPGVNNLWLVNQQAGIAPVVVDASILTLVQAGIDAYHQTNGLTNIAMGSVIRMWHDQRNLAQDGGVPTVPLYADLRAAMDHVNINDIIIDTQASTLFIDNPHMTLDVGAIAKGYAIERAVEIAESVGLHHFLISAGGDLRMLAGPPATGRWATGIQNPLSPDDGSIIDAVRGEHLSVVTSGTYQRYFEVDGIRFHHIIDPRTLFPADQYMSLTIIHDDSLMAEVLSTVLYMLSPEESQPILNALGGYAMWVTYDGAIVVSDGYSQFSDNF